MDVEQLKFTRSIKDASIKVTRSISTTASIKVTHPPSIHSEVASIPIPASILKDAHPPSVHPQGYAHSSTCLASRGYLALSSCHSSRGYLALSSCHSSRGLHASIPRTIAD